MATLVRTIWQSQEVKVGQATSPDGNITPFENKNLPGNVEMIESPKLFTSRKKAVSFHGVEMPKLDDCMQWRLQLKRSSASTNVSLLNLAESDKEDSQDNDILSEPDVISETSETPILPEAEKECCAESSLDLTENTVLMKANDSISDLKMKNSKINQHVQSLKVECSALCENLELRHQEAEELENYCNQLEESCKRLNKCVEEAENKTNAMRLKSITLEEKLNSLYKKVEDAIGKREKQLKELEECVGDSITGLSDGEHLNHPQSQEEEAKTDDSQIADLCKTIESLLSAITGLQQSMEKDAQKTEKGKVVAAMETQDMKVCVAVLDDIRNNLFQLNSKHERESTLHKNVHRVVFHMNARFDSFLSQWERVQKEQTHMMENIQELQANADGIYSLVKKISLSYGQIRGELDAFWQVKPLLEEVSRNLSVMKTQDATDMSGARNNNANFNIRQMIDQAMAPLLEEIKNYTPHGACMDCQRMQKKVADLEGQMVEKHTRAILISSELRLMQDDTIRLENMLLRDRIKTEGKIVLDNIKLKISSLQEHLGKLYLSKFATQKESINSLSVEPCTSNECTEQNIDNVTKE